MPREFAPVVLASGELCKEITWAPEGTPYLVVVKIQGGPSDHHYRVELVPLRERED